MNTQLPPVPTLTKTHGIGNAIYEYIGAMHSDKEAAAWIALKGSIAEAMQSYATAYGEQCARAAVERVAALEGALQAIGDLAASSRSGPGKTEVLEGIEEMTAKAIERRGGQYAPLSVRNTVNEICQAVAELPDQNSPEDWPEAMLVTHDELQFIVTEALADTPPAVEARVPDAVSNKCSDLLRELGVPSPRTCQVCGLGPCRWPEPLSAAPAAPQATQPPTQQASAQPPSQAAVDERAEFEAWAKDAGWPHAWRYCNTDGSGFSSDSWLAWKARASLTPKKASAQGEQAQQASAQPTQAAKDVQIERHPSMKPFKCPVCASPYFGAVYAGGEHVGRYCKGWPSSHDRSYIECRGKHEEMFDPLRASNTGQEKSS